MSTWIEYKIPYLFSSSSDAGATNISEGGGSFEVQFERPIFIPRDAENCYIVVQNATAWWNFFNIKEDVNDKIGVEYDNGVIVTTATLQLEAGLYDLEHLDAEIKRALVDAAFPDDLFTLLPDQATGKLIVQFNYSDTQLDFAVNDNFAELAGFEERDVPAVPTTSNLQFEKGDKEAKLNQISYLLLHSDLVARGLRINNKYNNTIAQINIDVPPGSQIISTPFHPPPIPADELVGERRTNIRFWLTDQDNNQLDPKGEIFSCRLVIHYMVDLQRRKDGGLVK